jgi:hypothetical protein
MIVLACLSPEEMLLSTEIGGYAAAFGIGITLTSLLLSWHQRAFRWLPVCLFLLLIHPAWTIGVGGDCGAYKRFMSTAISIVFVAVIVCQIFFPNFSRLRFLFRLCAATWVLSIPVIVGLLFHSPVLTIDFARSVTVPYIFAAPRLFVIAVALSLLWVALWLFERIRHTIRERKGKRQSAYT